MEQPSASEPIKYSKALVFPFKQPNWQSKMWWVFLINLVPIPFVSLILIRGWKLNVIKRVVRKKEEILPDIEEVLRLLGDGLILWLMALIYGIPLLIILAMLPNSPVNLIAETLINLFQLFGNKGFPDLSSFSFDNIIDGLVNSLLLSLSYYLITWPIYRTGAIRFSATSNAFVFFEIGTNIKIVGQHLNSFMLVLFFTFVTQILVFFIGLLLAIITVNGILIELICVSLYYWTMASLESQLGLKILHPQDISNA